MPIGATIAAISALVGVGTSLSTTAKRGKREKAQIEALREQYGDVLGRTGEIEAFYDSLTEFAQQGTELEREDVSRDFFSKALGLTQERSSRVRSSGLVKTGTSDIELAETIAGRDVDRSLAGIEQGRQGELLRIGKARETELQGLDDILFGLETEILGRGGSLEEGGGFLNEFNLGGSIETLPTNIFSFLTGVGR